MVFQSCSQKVRLREEIESKKIREQVRQARILANIDRREFLNISKPNDFGSYTGTGSCKISHSVEDARRRAIDIALTNIARSFQITVSSMNKVEIYDGGERSTSPIENLTNEIKTSALAVFRNVQPLIYYDKANHRFHAVIKAEKHKIESSIRERDKRAKIKATYYFEKGLNNYRRKAYSKALANYFYAYYLSSQVFWGNATYYDNKFRRQYDIQIESRERINNILRLLRIEKGKTLISDFRVSIASTPPSVMPYIPFSVENHSFRTDERGLLRLEGIKNKKKIKLQIDFQKMRDLISNEFYGFTDSDCIENVFENSNNFIASFEKKVVRIQFYTDYKALATSSAFQNYNDSNISLIFSKPQLSMIQVSKIINNNYVPEQLPMPGTILGIMKIKRRKIDDRMILIADFHGVYITDEKRINFFKLQNMKAIGYTKAQSAAKLKRLLVKKILEIVN